MDLNALLRLLGERLRFLAWPIGPLRAGLAKCGGWRGWRMVWTTLRNVLLCALVYRLLKPYAIRKYGPVFWRLFARPVKAKIRDREIFRTTRRVEPKKKRSVQPHEELANLRSSICGTARFMSELMSRPFYYYGLRSAQSCYEPLGHTVDTVKTFNAVARDDIIPRDAFVYVDDQDYYFDFSALVGQNHAICLSTFIPEDAAHICADCSYRFVGSSCELTVGHSTYVVRLWNYRRDYVTFTRWYYVCGIPVWPIYYHYEVNIRHMGNNRALVFLNPCGSALFGHSEPLERVEVHNKRGTFVVGQNNDYVSVAVNGQFTNSVRVPMTLHTACMVHRDSSLFSVSKVKLLAERLKVTLTEAAVAQIAAAYTIPPEEIVYYYIPKTDAVHNFSWGSSGGKQMMYPNMDPIVDGAIAPTRTLGNATRAVNERIVKTQGPDSVSWGYRRAATEFRRETIRRLGGGGKAHPKELEQVFEQLKSSAQKSVFARAKEFWLVMHRKVLSFIKAECYPKYTDPRVISQLDDTAKTRSAMYEQPVSESLKTLPWYGFKKPREVEDRIVEVASNSLRLAKTDYSRLDGHIGVEDNCQYLAFQLDFFAPTCATEVRECREYLNDLEGILHIKNEGEAKYSTGPTRKSGEPGTSNANTYKNASDDFVAIRLTHPDWFTERVYDSLGVYGGDDGISRDVGQFENRVRVAKMTNHSIELEPIERGGHVGFLSRVWGPGVWSGDRSNCSEPMRMWSKYHTCTQDLPDRLACLDQLARRATALWYTDCGAPLARDWLNRVHRDSLLKVEDHVIFGAYSVDTQDVYTPGEPPESGWYCKSDGWMEALYDEVLGVNMELWEAWCRGSGDILKPPLLRRAPAVIDGAVNLDATQIIPSDYVLNNPNPDSPDTLVIDGDIANMQAKNTERGGNTGSSSASAPRSIRIPKLNPPPKPPRRRPVNTGACVTDTDGAGGGRPRAQRKGKAPANVKQRASAFVASNGAGSSRGRARGRGTRAAGNQKLDPSARVRDGPPRRTVRDGPPRRPPRPPPVKPPRAPPAKPPRNRPPPLPPRDTTPKRKQRRRKAVKEVKNLQPDLTGVKKGVSKSAKRKARRRRLAGNLAARDVISSFDDGMAWGDHMQEVYDAATLRNARVIADM